LATVGCYAKSSVGKAPVKGKVLQKKTKKLDRS